MSEIWMEWKKREMKYVFMERRVGKFIKKFTLPVDYILETISTMCQDGLQTIIVPKIPQSELEKNKFMIIEVKIA